MPWKLSRDALANLTGGFPATVIGSPSRERICRRNRMSLAGVETPRKKVGGTSRTLTESFHKHSGEVSGAASSALGAVVEHVVKA